MKTMAVVVLVLAALLVPFLSLDAQAQLPVLAVEALGCVLCEAGQTAAFRVNIANPDGVPRTVHLIVQAELPSGQIVLLIDGPVPLQARFTLVPVISVVLTPDQPAGTYWFDSAIFDSEDEIIDAYSLRADKID